jgi:hypothetical protein
MLQQGKLDRFTLKILFNRAPHLEGATLRLAPALSADKILVKKSSQQEIFSKVPSVTKKKVFTRMFPGEESFFCEPGLAENRYFF